MDCTSNNSATLDADDLEQQINKRTQQDEGGLEITAIMAVNKGKRTKRHRLHTSDSSSPVLSSSINDRHEKDNRVIEEDDEELQLDMAECLILLAQGESRPSSSYSLPPVSVRRDRLGRLSGSKRRRSYSSSSLSFGLAAGVYECQTCNRTFPTFQALGGHRASHKKLNITTTAAAIANSHHDYFIHPLSLQLGNKNYIRAQSTDINNKKSINKIHECTICGAEFSSGQALGGHMRRHRGSVAPLDPSTSATTNNTIAANTTLSLNSTAIIDITSAAAGKVVDRINDNDDSFLSLDLNLPASSSPELDTKFSLHPKQQSAAAMAFASTPALVNCFH